VSTTMSTNVLERGRQLVQPELAAAVNRLAPDLRAMAHYHLGWTDSDGRPVKDGGGKGIRGALAILSAEAASADGVIGVPGGVAVELVHNFSLIHDDVIDLDRERRHRPTVWAVYGIGAAICAGDALLSLAQQVLLESQNPAAKAAALCLGEASGTMIAGQVDDLSFDTRSAVSIAESVAMCEQKTGALLACAASIGAILAAAPLETVTALKTFGAHLGLAFQAIDDVLGIWGDPAMTGKAVGGDLRQAKKSLPVAMALAAGTSGADELRSMLASGGLLDDWQVKRAAELVESCGGREWAMQLADTNLDAALSALDGGSLDTAAQQQLADLAVFAIQRNH
jgi:geranylgeranyl diphosphate synthase, type I